MLNTLVAHKIYEAERDGAVTFQLADNRTRMEVVAARHPQSLGQDAEMDAVNLLSIDDGVHGSMYVKQQAVFSSIPSQGRVGRESTGDVVMHYDGHAKHLRGLGSVQHALARPGSGIQVVTLDLTCLGLGFVDSFSHEEESIAPPHKRLRVNVLVILQPASQTLIHRPAVVVIVQPNNARPYLLSLSRST